METKESVVPVTYQAVPISSKEFDLFREVLETRIADSEKFINALHIELEKRTDLQFLNIEKATKIALEENTKSLAKLNELRGILEDSNKTYATKTENTKDHDRFEDAVRLLTELKSDKIENAKAHERFELAISLMVTKVENTKDHDRFLERISELTTYKDQMNGKASTESVDNAKRSAERANMRAVVSIAIAIAGLLIGLIEHFIK